MGLFQRKQTVLAFAFLSFLWLLYAFSSGNADFGIHLTKFENYRDFSSQTELIYSALMWLFNSLGLNYRGFLIFDSLFVCAAYYYFVKRNTNYSNFVLALYFIYPFCMDVTMVRYTLAFSVVLYGLESLWKKDSVRKFIVCVVVAFLIHSSMVLMLLLLLPYYFNNGTIKRVTLFGVLGLLVGGSALKRFFEIVSGISLFNIGTKSSIVLKSSMIKYDSDVWLRYGFKFLLLACIMFFVFSQISKFIKNISSVLDRDDIVKVKMIEFAMRLNIASLLVIPLIMFSADVFRFQLSISIVFYVAVANYLELKRKFKPTRNNMFVLWCVVVYALLGLYMWVLNGPNIDSVWKPLFNNNVLFG